MDPAGSAHDPVSGKDIGKDPHMAAGHQNSDDPLSLINRDSVRQNPLAGKVAEEQAGNPNLAFKGFLSHRPGFLLHGFQGHILLNAVR